MKIKNNKQLRTSGFTLIEVMAAVAIMSIGLVGGLTAINNNLKNISGGEQRIVAVGLAEEGIEMARNMRDTNWLAGAPWDTGFGFGPPNNLTKTKLSFFCDGSLETAQGKNATQNWNDTIDGPGCNGNTCMIFEYDTGSNFACYSDDFGSNVGLYNRVNPRTMIRRLITAEQIDPNSIKVTVYLRWTNSNGTFSYLPPVEETLYNWK